MGVDLIYPTINLFQYNLREGLGEDEPDMLAKSRNFYQKFLPDLTEEDLSKYRQCERYDREFNELLSARFQSLSQGLDGFYYPIQLGDTYALHLNFSGKLVGDKPDKRPKDFKTAVGNLELAKILPPLDAGSFGQTILLTAFIDNFSIDKLEIAKGCDLQITGKSSIDLARSMSRGKWLGGELFEFWTPPLSLQDNNFQEVISNHPHTIVWLFPVAKLNDADEKIISSACQNWIRLCHYRHKIFYAYYQSQELKQQLKSANIAMTKIATRLKTENSSLHHLQRLLFDTLAEFQSYGENVQSLADQQQTISTNSENYRSRCEAMIAKDPNHSLQFLLEFETKYGNKYQRQITADRAHLDSGLKVLENLSQTIQGTIQIEQTKSDRFTNLLIASVGSGLAISQVVSSILLVQYPPAKSTNFYETYAFQSSLMYGLIPIGLIMGVYFLWGRRRK
jgi:hypothetical protein